MRTTLKLSTEALAKVRQIAQQRRMTLGTVASELILKALEPIQAPRVRNGVPQFHAHWESKHQSAAPDLELVNRLREMEQ